MEQGNNKITIIGNTDNLKNYQYNKLAEKLTIGVRILYWTVQFHETYPSNLNPGSNLSWSHYRLLLTIKDENKRKEYEHIIETEGLSKRELEELIKKEKSKENSNKTPILVEKRGLLNLYKLSKLENISITTFYLDLEFRVYLDKLNKGDTSYSEGNIVRVKNSKNDYNFTLMAEDKTNKLYTYTANFLNCQFFQL